MRITPRFLLPVGIGSTIAVIAILVTISMQRNDLSSVIGGQVESESKDRCSMLARDVVLVAQTSSAESQQKVNHAIKLAWNLVDTAGGVRTVQDKLVPWNAVSQVDGSEIGVVLKTMTIGRSPISKADDFAVNAGTVDRVTELSGALCTIFQRMNEAGDMLRISTSVKNAAGKRAIGTYIPAKLAGGTANPVLESVLAGKDYIGRAPILGVGHQAIYSPIKEDGVIVGMLFVGVRDDATPEMVAAIRSMAIGKTGGVSIFDRSGRCLISRDEKMEGTAIDRAKQGDLAELLGKATAGDVVSGVIPWKDSSGRETRRIVAALGLPQWDWTIVAGAEESELMAPRTVAEDHLVSMAWMISIVTIVTFLVVCVVIVVLVRVISRQVQNIHVICKGIDSGTVGVAVDEAGKPLPFTAESNDEIADIVRSIDGINRTVVAARDLQHKVEADNADIQRSIQALGDVLLRIADNDFTVRAEVTEGTMGMVASALNMTIESLVETIGEATKVAQQAAEAAKRITQQASKQGDDAERTTQETVSAGDAVRSIVTGLNVVADKAGVAAATAGRAREQADAGAESVNKMVSGMDDLSESVAATSKKIKALGDRSMEIVGMVSAIAKISERTSLLALNASIEAARAGEHGRGFSVVADNVKDLSEKAQSTTGDIDRLAKQIQVETNDGVSAMEEQTANVSQGVQMAGDAGKALDAIKQSANQSADVVNEIALIAKEQTAGAGKAIEVMGGLRSVAEAGLVRSRETIASASELAAVAQDLTERLAKFKIA